MLGVKRREFITLLGGAAGWPLAARAQQTGTMRRVGVLLGWREDIPQIRALLAAFVQGLAELGWVDGRNLQIDVRWTNANVDRARAFAKELVDLQPDVILAGTTPVTAALAKETRTIPVVFVVVSDPVGAGFVGSLARPGGNVTGFINEEGAMGGKWLALLREVAPHFTRAAIMFNPETAPGGGTYFLGSFEAAAKAMMVEPITARVHSDAEIESAIAALGGGDAGLVMMTDSFMAVHQGTVISGALRHKVPTITDAARFAQEGGLLAYGSRSADTFRRSAGYVDRILRGAKPSDLPVQVPTLFEMVINLKTAKALGLEVPLFFQQRADEVIE
jgi:putative tryptophan/tyrosine transport system substrate-binding protein